MNCPPAPVHQPADTGQRGGAALPTEGQLRAATIPDTRWAA